MPEHQRQLRLCIDNGNNTASREAAAHQEVEAVQRDAMRQPVGTNKEGGQGWKCEMAARRKVKQGGGMQQKATRQPAGKREANGRRGTSRQEVTGP